MSGLPEPIFHGSDYDEKFDRSRLQEQQLRIYELMKDGRWHTKKEVAIATGYSEASILAQFGNLRKLGIPVDKRSRGERNKGLYEFRMGVPGDHIPKTSPVAARAELAEVAAAELANALRQYAPSHPALAAYYEIYGDPR